VTKNQLLFPDCGDEDIFLIDGNLHKVSNLRQSFCTATDSELINPLFKDLAAQNINLGWWHHSNQYFEKWISKTGQECQLLSPGNPAWLNISLKFAAIARFYTESTSSDNDVKVNIGNGNDIISFGDNRMYIIAKVQQALELKLKDSMIGLRLINALGQTLSISSQDFKARYQWFTTGKDCEYFKVGASGWQKGVIKLGFYVGVVNQNGEFEAMDWLNPNAQEPELKESETVKEPEAKPENIPSMDQEPETIPTQPESRMEEPESPLDSIRKSLLDYNQ